MFHSVTFRDIPHADGWNARTGTHRHTGAQARTGTHRHTGAQARTGTRATRAHTGAHARGIARVLFKTRNGNNPFRNRRGTKEQEGNKKGTGVEQEENKIGTKVYKRT